MKHPVCVRHCTRHTHTFTYTYRKTAQNLGDILVWSEAQDGREAASSSYGWTSQSVDIRIALWPHYEQLDYIATVRKLYSFCFTYRKSCGIENARVHLWSPIRDLIEKTDRFRPHNSRKKIWRDFFFFSKQIKTKCECNFQRKLFLKVACFAKGHWVSDIYKSEGRENI